MALTFSASDRKFPDDAAASITSPTIGISLRFITCLLRDVMDLTVRFHDFHNLHALGRFRRFRFRFRLLLLLLRLHQAIAYLVHIVHGLGIWRHAAVLRHRALTGI